MNSPYDAGLSFPSFHGNFGGRDGLEGMIDNRAHQYNTALGIAQIESHRDWVFQKIKDLMAAKANIEAELREYQDLYYKRQYARAQQIAHMPYTPITTTTPNVPFTTTSPYSTTTVSPHSFSHTANLSPSQGETWNIPNHLPSSSTSQLSTAGAYAQPATPRLPRYTVLYRAGKRIFLCECGHEASREGDMKRHRESLGHAKRSYICPTCLKSFTRKDSLLRHTNTHA